MWDRKTRGGRVEILRRSNNWSTECYEVRPQDSTEIMDTHHLDHNVISSGKCAVTCRRLRGFAIICVAQTADRGSRHAQAQED